MGLIGFEDTKKKAVQLKRKQKFHKDIKVKPVRSAFGKVAYYEVVGTPKKIFKKTIENKKEKRIISFVKHKGKNVRLSTSIYPKGGKK